MHYRENDSNPLIHTHVKVVVGEFGGAMTPEEPLEEMRMPPLGLTRLECCISEPTYLALLKPTHFVRVLLTDLEFLPTFVPC